jgi:hypothetical protein
VKYTCLFSKVLKINSSTAMFVVNQLLLGVKRASVSFEVGINCLSVNCTNSMLQAQCLVVGLKPRRPEFEPRTLRVGFMTSKVEQR